jgi:hypothetical protein
MEPIMSEKLTEELYGEVPLLFDSYYKFSFTFVGDAPDGAHDVYRYTVERDKPDYIINGFTYLQITKDGKLICDLNTARW